MIIVCIDNFLWSFSVKLFKVVAFVVTILLLTSIPYVSNAKGLPLKSGKLAALTQRGKQLAAGVGLLAICTGCGSKMVVDKKYAPVLATTAITSFAANVTLGILASQEKVSPALPWAVTGVYIAAFIFAKSSEFDYGEGGLHTNSGGVDWYGMNNDLYSEYLVYGIRIDGQQQYEARQHELEPHNYHYVLAHLRHNGHDYAAVVKRPWQPRRRVGPPYGLRIRIPSNRSLPKPKVTIVDSLQPHDNHRAPLDAVMGVYLTDHPDYKHDEWVTITDGERILYGKIIHHFTSEYAQVRILAVKEGDGNQVMLPEDSDIYSVYPLEHLQREETAAD